MNLLLFESFTRKMLDERDRIYNDVVKKYTESLKNFLHEITDKFTPVKFQIGPGSTGAMFNVWFKVEIKDVDEFFEVFHEDIFDRVKFEYPGTTTKFKIGLKRKFAEAYPWTYFSGLGELVDCNDENIQMVCDYIKEDGDIGYSHFIICLFIS